MRSFLILVVEDFEPFRRFVCSVMQQRAEFQVTQASDGEEAVQKAEELQPDLILLDVWLPKLNGIEVARRVRKLAPHAKILFLSEEPSLRVVREALKLGALGYVLKQDAPSDLLTGIEKVLEGKRFIGPGLEFWEEAHDPAPRPPFVQGLCPRQKP